MLSTSSEPKAGRQAGEPAPAGMLDSATLLAGGIEVLIRHGAEVYRLRVTRQNRLILTK